jgi:hypothetical protein
MGKAIVYVTVTFGSALICVLWNAFDRAGDTAIFTLVASLLSIGVAIPVLVRKDFQFVGIPGPVEIFFAACALGAAVLGGLKSDYWFWAAAFIHLIPSVRVSLVSLKAYQRPKNLKIAVGIGLAALFGLNVFLGYRHSEWLGRTSTALVKEWFPEATAPKDRTETASKPKPPPPATPVNVDPAGPIAVVAGRPLTKDMVEYQRYIDGLVDSKSDRNDAIAALLQAYTSRAILEKKFNAFQPEMLKDERQWLLNRTRDSQLVQKIRSAEKEELFLDVYVGANGFYKRKLQEIFASRKQEELKKRAAEVLKEVQKADGVERPGPKLEAVKKEECRYSFKQREFIGKFDTDQVEQLKPDPKDELAAKLARLEVNTTLPEIVWGDMNALIIRRIPDDFKKRQLYETYRVIEDGLYSVWFKKQCGDLVIEIFDPPLRREMLDLAKDVNHIIKTK